jgi:hypothetical protein
MVDNRIMSTADNHPFKGDTKVKNSYPSYSVYGICLSLVSLLLLASPTLIPFEALASSSGLKVIVDLDDGQEGNLCVYSRNERLECQSVEGETTEEFQFSEDSVKTGEKFRACLEEDCITGVNGPEKEPEHVSFESSESGSTSPETNIQSSQMNSPNPGDQSQSLAADMEQNQNPSESTCDWECIIEQGPPSGDVTDQLIEAMESGAIDPGTAGMIGNANNCLTNNAISGIQGPVIEGGFEITHTDPSCPGMTFNGP